MTRETSSVPMHSAPMPAFTAIDVAERSGVALVTLNRPDRHNAFDATMIAELTRALTEIEARPQLGAVVLRGAGESFCAGADLAWMKRMAAFSYEENVADARALARLLQALATLPKPTIARVHGPAYGGGVGLVACCDIALAVAGATFSLSEVRLGLIPATIGPYVIEAMGARAARRYFLTAERFDAAEACRAGLVHDVVPSIEALDERVDELLGHVMLGGPHAQAAAKALTRAVAHRPIDEHVVADTAERIATVRASDEAREGVAAFLGRRSPAWVPEGLRKRRS